MDRKKLEQALLKTNKITRENLNNAAAMHEKIGGDFAALLVKLGYTTDEEITALIGKLEGIETIDVSNAVLPKKLIQSIPQDVIKKYDVLPISRKGDQITLAMADVNDYKAIEEIQFLTGCKLEPVLASREAIRKAIIQFYYEEDELEWKEGSSPEGTKQEKSIEESPYFLKALVVLLAEKNLITYEELTAKMKAISSREKV